MRSFRISRTVCALVLAACCALSALPLRAQDDPDNKPEAPEKPKDKKAWEELIYLPYKNLTRVFDKQDATVFLPYGQFLKLWEAAYPDAMHAHKAPVSAVITEAKYIGKVENNLVRIDAAFKVQALDKNWSEVPLRFGDAAVGKLTTKNDKVILRGTGEGTYALMLPEKGEYTIQLELTSRVRTSTEGRSFELEVPPVAITQLELTIPAPDQTVETTPHLTATSVAAGDEATKIQADLGATQKLGARWFPRVTRTPEMELLATVDNLQNIRIADGLVHTEATLNYQVLRGQLDQVRIAVPTGHRILDVTAQNLKGWKAEKEANRQLLVVDLLQSPARNVAVEVRTEHAAGDEAIDLSGIGDDGVVHGIHSLGAVRESGMIVLGHSADLVLTLEQQQGVVRVEASEAPAASRRPDAQYFRFYSPNFKLQVVAKPVQPRISVENRTRIEFREEELQLTADLQYTIERSGVFELRFQIPEGLKIDRVDCEQKKEFTLSPNGRELVVSLNEKTQGAVHVTLHGRQSLPGDKQESKLSLPIPEPVGVAREQGWVKVYAPEALEIITDEKKLAAAQPDRTQGIEQLPNLRLASAWTYTRRPVEIPVTTIRRPTRLTADVATTLQVREDLAEVTSILTFNVLYAGVDTFRFSVPEAIASKVQIDSMAELGGAPIKQRTKADEAQDGWVTWTVVLQRDALGKQPFRIRYDLLPGKKEGPLQYDLRPPRVLGLKGDNDEGEKVPLSRIYGEIAVVKDRALSINAAPKDLESIDVRELTLLPQEGALAYRYYAQPVDLAVAAVKHDLQHVVQTVVSRGLVEAVVTQGESVTYRARYTMKSSERQRLPLDLPAQAEILGVMVAGKQVSLEKNDAAPAGTGRDAYFVNVARTTRSDEPFTLSILFRTPQKLMSARWLGGPVPLQLPRLGNSEEGGEAVAIQQLRVVVWVPDQFALVGTPDKFILDDQPDVQETILGRLDRQRPTGRWDTWIGDSSSSLFEFPVAGHAYEYSNLGGAGELDTTWWCTTWVTWIFTIALVLIAVVLSRTGWENKVGVLLIAGFAAALYALADADAVAHLVAVCRFGILAMILYWIIQTFARRPVMPAPATVVPAVIPPPGIFDQRASGGRQPPDA